MILEILNSQSEAKNMSIVKEKYKKKKKKWDKATKNLTKNNLIKVEKIDEKLMMILI